jgi:hypothetical protein
MAVVIDQPYWGCSVAAGSHHGLVLRLVQSHGSCWRYSCRCVRIVKIHVAGVELEEVSWAVAACSCCETIMSVSKFAEQQYHGKLALASLLSLP